MTSDERRGPRLQGWHITLICMTLAAAVLAPYASQLHDGFEAVMDRLGMPVEKPNVNPETRDSHLFHVSIGWPSIPYPVAPW